MCKTKLVREPTTRPLLPGGSELMLGALLQYKLKKGKKGPRQTWHDLLCKIEGPGAYDVLKNFEQQWLKAIDSCKIGQLFKRMKGVHLEEDLIEIGKEALIACPSTSIPNHHSEQWHVQDLASIESGRYMVYFHSKGIIVDDAYVLIGSANINERSMAGSRGTEISMGAYQPHQTWAKNNEHPRG